MITRYNKFITDSYTHKNLSKRFWNNYKLDDGVRKKLVEVAKDFFDSLNLDDIDIKEIKLTGSLANFNYTDKSDLDVHIIVDLSDYDGDKDVLLDMMTTKCFVWNLKHDINIRGADVELYVQDVNEAHQSTGLYSLIEDKWIKKPEYTDPEVDEDDVNSKFNKWVKDISLLKKGLDNNLSDEEAKLYYKRVEKMKKKLRQFRKKGLHEGEGEFSVENIAYKRLRNKGYIDTLYDLGYKYYDMIYSQ